MNKILILLALTITISLQAQDINAKLGGNTINETYDITDSGDNLLFRIQGDAGALFLGTFGTGTIPPATGAGTRMMWHPRKAAFRVGSVDGMQWNDVYIGDYSTAMGQNTRASGLSSTAMGQNTTASGNHSTAMGYYTTASGWYSTALGSSIKASGNYSIAIALNDQNGTDVTQYNTMAIMGGKVGIGTTTPGSKLAIVGLSEYTDNATAKAAGLVLGDLYRTGDLLKIVH